MASFTFQKDISSLSASEVELALQHLSDWMIEERLISSDQWELIRQENFSQKYQYEALLNQLLPIQNPTGFITVRESLSEDGHFSIEIIDNQESERDDQTASGLQGVLTNDEIKRRIRNIFSQFVSEVQPTLLTDRLIQRKVITNDRWERIRQENPTPKSQCEALLTYLLSIQHPRAFVIIWKALHEHGHFLLKSIDNQESEQANQTAILDVVELAPQNLSDWFTEEKLISTDHFEQIHQQNPTPKYQYQALLKQSLPNQNPTEFVSVRETLSKEGRSSLEHFNNQESKDDDQTAVGQRVTTSAYSLSGLSGSRPGPPLDSALWTTSLTRRSTSVLTNDEIKRRIRNNFSRFMSEVPPTLLTDRLIQEKVITSDMWERISQEYLTPKSQCQALLTHLLSIQHPKAFIIVREALQEKGHSLLESIDNPESEHGQQTIVQARSLGAKLELAVEAQCDEGSAAAGSSETEPLLGRQPGIQKKTSNKKTIRNIVLGTIGGVALIVAVLLVINYTFKKPTLGCIPDPTFDQTIKTQLAKEIRGLAILEEELFVVSSQSSKVEVYNSVNFSFSREWKLKKLIAPEDMVSCSRNKCLYIMDKRADDKKPNEILRVDPNGTLINSWRVGSHFGRMSITDEANLLFTVYDKNKLIEYSPDGEWIRNITFSPDTNISHPRHAIKMANGHFLVSHGLDHEELHRVCVVDENGTLTKSFGERPGSSIGRLNDPIYLSLCGNGFVVVADHKNSRVLSLDSDLTFQREILSKEKHGLRLPYRILLDESIGRFFVADNELNNPRIVIFDFK